MAGKFAVGSGGFRRAAAPLAEAGDLDHPHPAIERHGHDIAYPQRVARRLAALAVESDMPGLDQRRGIGPRADDTRMP